MKLNQNTKIDQIVIMEMNSISMTKMIRKTDINMRFIDYCKLPSAPNSISKLLGREYVLMESFLRTDSLGKKIKLNEYMSYSPELVTGFVEIEYI